MPSQIQIIPSLIKSTDVIFVERKGIGHPDTLSDNLAEHLSALYSNFTLRKYGAILHHNFDKLGILGGKSKVSFGEGSVTSPIRVLINGRISTSFGGEIIPYEIILTAGIHEFILQRFNGLIPTEMINIEFNISNASSPGHANKNENKGSARNFWFNPRNLDDLPERDHLFSNDTSIGCGYYPLHPLEDFILKLEKELTIGDFGKSNDWIGTDIKMMGSQIGEDIDITLCVPQIARYVHTINEYKHNIETVHNFLQSYAFNSLGSKDIKFSINTRDNYESEELYLTATGSSIESGDEGLVGRGNRVNEIISINHPMSMEGASGKNPVYHIGKLYYIAAHRIAKAINERFGVYNEVFLVSQSGRTLTDPWKVVVRIDNMDIQNLDTDKIDQFVRLELQKIPQITEELIHGAITIS